MTNTLLSLARTALYTLAAGLAVLILFVGWAEVLSDPTSPHTAGILVLSFFFASLVMMFLGHLGMVAESALWRREHEAAMSLLYPRA